ncbi:MAG TPA: dihydropteroate synthase [Acidimicrobiales bacterium]|nr:dihydropteroate synthase [Acidimicrobiales bacterium]
MARAMVMGVLNVTPDSFSDGGLFADAAVAIEHGRRLFAEGADIVDVGGESTRPGSEPVSVDAECERVVPVIAALASVGRVSVDTSKAAVAEAAIAAGATVVNDISASLAHVAAAHGAGWVAMHMQGTPGTMQVAPSYDDVVEEVVAFLAERTETGRAAGVTEMWIDPGIGFGKTLDHNLALLRHLRRFVATGVPVAVGASRKGFLGTLTGGAAADDRLEASLAVATWAFSQGVSMVRAHDVAATVQAARIVTEEVAA